MPISSWPRTIDDQGLDGIGLRVFRVKYVYSLLTSVVCLAAVDAAPAGAAWELPWVRGVLENPVALLLPVQDLPLFLQGAEVRSCCAVIVSTAQHACHSKVCFDCIVQVSVLHCLLLHFVACTGSAVDSSGLTCCAYYWTVLGAARSADGCQCLAGFGSWYLLHGPSQYYLLRWRPPTALRCSLLAFLWHTVLIPLSI